jgi:hypothetical protein
MKPVKELDRWTITRRLREYKHIHSPFSKIIKEYHRDDLFILERHLLDPAISLKIYNLFSTERMTLEIINRQ